MNWKKIRRKARRWVRKYRSLLLVLVLAAVALLLMPKESHDEYDDFLNELGFRESSNNYAAVNRYNYLGRYQLGKMGLQEAGFMDENGGWTALANSYGIYSQADFLTCPEGQDAAVRAYHQRTCYYIRVMGMDAYVGSTYCGVEVTPSGLLAACHLVGIGSMKEGLTTGQHVYDGNHVSAAVYMELFAGYDVSTVWQN